MNILNNPVNTFSFDDIVSFCGEKVPEGWQIDYKVQPPQKGFSTHFSAFSNTRGGIIIIGVEEDKHSGLPISWNGIDDDAKVVEKINQEAANVDPIPSYEIHKTNSKNGKVFVLIRIFEGDKTPYYVQNDPRVWVRTGNIKNPIDLGHPDWVELLFKKRETAEKTRMNLLKNADIVYQSALEKEERERKQNIRIAIQKGDGSEKNFYQQELGLKSRICTISLQPFYPKKPLAFPREMKSRLEEFLVNKNFDTFPNRNLKPIPQGLISFLTNYDGYVESQQLYSQGLIHNKLDVLRIDREGNKYVYLSYIAGRLYVLFQSATLFYKAFNYQGVIKGKLQLENMKDVYISEIRASGYHFWDHDIVSFLDNYEIDFEIETSTLNNSTTFYDYYYSLIREIYWNVGYENLSEDILKKFLRENRLLT